MRNKPATCSGESLALRLRRGPCRPLFDGAVRGPWFRGWRILADRSRGRYNMMVLQLHTAQATPMQHPSRCRCRRGRDAGGEVLLVTRSGLRPENFNGCKNTVVSYSAPHCKHPIRPSSCEPGGDPSEEKALQVS